MKVDRSLFDNMHWTRQYDGKCVVYMLEWGGKRYIGSTTSLRTRMHSARSQLKLQGVTACTVRNIVEVPVLERFRLEELNIIKFNTIQPFGHNKTWKGQGGGYSGSNRGYPEQKPGRGHKDLFCSPKWAREFDGKCVVYVLEWGGKKYVGTSVQLSIRLNVHRRNLSAVGVNEGKVVKVYEVDHDARKESEAAAIKKFKTLMPNGHNRTKNGGLQANWDDPVYRAVQKAAWEDEARRQNMRVKSRQNWANPDYRNKLVSGMRSAERREAQSTAIKENWKDPVKRQKYMAAHEAAQTPELRARISATLKALWRDPRHRAKMLKAFKSAETRKKSSISSKAHFSDPANRAKRSKATKAVWEDPERRKVYEKAISEHGAKIRALWEDPAQRAKYMAGLKLRDEKLKQSGKLKDRFNDPIFKAKFLEALRQRDIRTKERKS